MTEIYQKDLILVNNESLFDSVCVSHLHKKARNKRFSNINIIVATSKVSARSLQTKPIHDPRELSADIVGALQ